MNVDAIPEELRARPHWVVWKHEKRGKKLTKVPYRFDVRTRAKSDDPRTWGTFEDAIAVPGDCIQGLGFCFSSDDPYTAIDLDDCIDPQTGELHPAAAEILEELGGYQERSPSGIGMHAIVRGKVSGDRRETAQTPWGTGEIGIYDSGRYFTITGNGSGEITDAQEQLDALVERVFGAPSQNGARPASDEGAGAGPSVEKLLDRHDDLAKITARKGTKPKGGTPSDWDFMLGCRAAEYGYDDEVLGALIRHARAIHNDDKGERDDYVERTIRAVRRRVGQIGAEISYDELLAELTRALRVDERGRRVSWTRVVGHGNAAAAAIGLDDGYEIEFSSFEHISQPAKLADQLATTIAIVTEFSKLQARRVASLVRLTASRGGELHDREIYVEEALRLLRLAQVVAFNFTDQGDRWRVWADLDALDPEETFEPDLYKREGRRHESKTAEAYARRVLIPRDKDAGVRFVRTSWFQHFIRLRLGSSATPHQARNALLAAGWAVRGKKGQIRATEPDGDRTLISAFYLVPRDWEVF